MKQLPLASAVLICATASAQAAPGAPTKDDQTAACTGDAFRLCSAHIPNEDQITRCMAANRPRLSPACRVVFDASGTPKRRSAVATPR
jgi:hypothetical protein